MEIQPTHNIIDVKAYLAFPPRVASLAYYPKMFSVPDYVSSVLKYIINFINNVSFAFLHFWIYTVLVLFCTTWVSVVLCKCILIIKTTWWDLNWFWQLFCLHDFYSFHEFHLLNLYIWLVMKALWCSMSRNNNVTLQETDGIKVIPRQCTQNYK